MDGDVIVTSGSVKPTPARSSALASSWAAFANGTENFNLAQGNGHQFDFQLTVANMYKLLPSTFYVELVSNDPCYIPEDPGADPQEIITYQATYGYCQPETGFMAFGTDGKEWYNNFLAFGDADLTETFTVTGSGTPLFDGTMFFMTSMDDAAWNPTSGGAGMAPTGFTYFYPFYVDDVSDCGGCDFDVDLPVQYSTDGGFTYSYTHGDLCSFAAIDSLQGNSGAIWPGEHQAGPSIGLDIAYREVGTYSIAQFPEFDFFKLVVFDVTNRNATPVNGLYGGNLADWDVQDYGDNKVDGDPINGFVYVWDVDDPDYYGNIGLPRTGSYYTDLTPTDPCYNIMALHNPTSTYTDQALDSLYDWVNDAPEDAVRYGTNAEPPAPPEDASSIITFFKTDLGGNETFSFGMALYGLLTPANPVDDINDLSIFINKYAGFGRGDVNDDGVIDLNDLVYLSNYAADPGANPGPLPFYHLGDVDADGDVDIDDVIRMEQYFFYYGPPPVGAFMF
jgi:hypothetical protein